MPEVQSPKQFFADFIACARTAKQRIYIQSMLFEYGDFWKQLEPVLTQKSQAGIEVHVTIDSVFKRYIPDTLHYWPVVKKIEKERHFYQQGHTKQLIQRLIKAGVLFTFTNYPSLIEKLFTISGRNHIKLYLVDDFVWIGGINANDISFTYIDFMVKFTDKIIVQGLAEQFYKVNSNKPKANYTISSPPYEVLVDAGSKGKSLIYNQATNLAKDARHTMFFASQFVPDGKLLRAIINATQRGVQATIITQPTEKFRKLPSRAPYEYFLRKTKNNPHIHFFPQATKVHAKLLIVDDKIAIFGSHNLVQIGVYLGTEEIAMKTNDPKLVNDLSKFMHSRIQS